MNLKRLYTTQPFRFRFLLLTGLLLLIGVDITQHSLTKYNIPLVGWVLAVGEYRYANAAYWQAIDEGVQPWQEHYATQIAFTHTHTASISTLAFLALVFNSHHSVLSQNRSFELHVADFIGEP